jgi:hypothetical protein
MKAFPTHKEEGMDLRDYFAAKAMQALIPATLDAIAEELITSKQITTAAYQVADLMMEARK